MLYLDEDIVNFQIKACQQVSCNKGIKCPKCDRQKPVELLCPLGREWVKDLVKARL